MIGAREIQVAQELVAELRRAGRDEQARALEAVVSAARVLAGRSAGDALEHLTTREAARALGVSIQTVESWTSSGELAAVELGGRRLIHRDEILRYLDTLRSAAGSFGPAGPVSEGGPSRIVASLPTAEVRRVQELHDKLESGAHLSPDERREMTALESQLGVLARRRLRDAVRRAGARGR